MKKILFFITLVSVILIQSCNAQAQDMLKISADSAKKPVVDGVIAKDEYSYTTSAENMTLYLFRTKDLLHVAISCKTAGWVSVGAGSSRMNNALIFLGYFSNGTARFTEQKGSGHSHSDVAQKDWISGKNTVSETNGVTVLEFVCPAGALISSGQKQLGLIIAFGNSDSFTSMHAARKGLSVNLE